MAVTTVFSFLPGTFYRRPSPGEPSFKAEGDTVSAADTVGLIEVMKTFTQVTADVDGKIVRFHVEHDDAVSPGQPLFDVET